MSNKLESNMVIIKYDKHSFNISKWLQKTLAADAHLAEGQVLIEEPR
jgi:hypothetical protein